MKDFIKKIEWKELLKKFCLWFFTILLSEITFVIINTHTPSWQLAINLSLTTVILSAFLSLITSLGSEKMNKIIIYFFLILFWAMFANQSIFYKIFKVYFSWYNLALQDQAGAFATTALKLIFENGYYLLLFLIPIILTIIFHKKWTFIGSKLKWQSMIPLLLIIGLFTGIFLGYMYQTKEDVYSTYDLYHNVNNVSLNIKRNGVVNSYFIELGRIIFGFQTEKIESVSLGEKQEIVTVENFEPNQLELKLEDTNNGNVNAINAYIKSETPTYKNHYTGMFKGYNLVYITAESFSEIGISEELTPTLYRLTNNGFVFKNFYTPNNLSTIGGEFQTLTGLYPDSSILSKWRSGTNTFPYALGTTFQKEGYATFAYHNNSYVFQDRHQYLKSQGFNNFLACYNGLEKRMNCERWPQSDDEMIEVTVNDYINSETPFLAYYMTVSGHFGYTFVGNSMASKNRQYVDGMDKGEGAKAYVATQIELDRALARLIQVLEEHNKLDNTVFVMAADHYPYGLDNASINSLSTYPRDDIEINHNALIIWNNKLEKTVVEKPCMSIDIIPTVYNLFGISYDSRLFTGKDILSTDFGIAILSDRSWVTSKGTYHASTGEFVEKEPIEEGYIEKVNTLVNSRMTISRMILQNNYYWYLVQ